MYIDIDSAIEFETTTTVLEDNCRKARLATILLRVSYRKVLVLSVRQLLLRVSDCKGLAPK